jgi:hypothetical protein
VTKIAGVPAQLAVFSKLLAEAGVELGVEAVSVADAPLPAMPPGVAGQVAGTLGRVPELLRRAALVAEREAIDTRKRALWFAAADSGAASAVAAVIGVKTVGQIPLDVLDVQSRVRVADMLKAWGRFERVAMPIANEYGPRSFAATQIWFAWQERNPMPLSRLRSVIAGAGSAEEYERAAGVPLAGLRAVATKVLGPIGVVTSVYSIVNPEHASGWERTGDRVAAGAGLLGSGSTTVLAFAPALANPAVDIAVGVLLVGAAGWEVYTHRRAIAHAVVGAGDFAWKHRTAILAPTPLGPAALAWDHKKDIARVAVTAGEGALHGVESGAHWLGIP